MFQLPKALPSLTLSLKKRTTGTIPILLSSSIPQELPISMKGPLTTLSIARTDIHVNGSPLQRDNDEPVDE
jgi:hypothetical protein